MLVEAYVHQSAEGVNPFAGFGQTLFDPVHNRTTLSGCERGFRFAPPRHPGYLKTHEPSLNLSPSRPVCHICLDSIQPLAVVFPLVFHKPSLRPLK